MFLVNLLNKISPYDGIIIDYKPKGKHAMCFACDVADVPFYYWFKRVAYIEFKFETKEWKVLMK